MAITAQLHNPNASAWSNNPWYQLQWCFGGLQKRSGCCGMKSLWGIKPQLSSPQNFWYIHRTNLMSISTSITMLILTATGLHNHTYNMVFKTNKPFKITPEKILFPSFQSSYKSCSFHSNFSVWPLNAMFLLWLKH
jgi:hypothetical protein